MAAMPDRIGVADIATVRDSRAQLVALDNRFGGADLTRLATRLYTDLHHRVGAGSYDPAIRADLMAAVGELAEIAGWIAYDADQHDLVRKLNLEALHFTRLAGDTSVELLTLQNASMHAGHLGMPNEALAIADSVLDGPYHLTPRLRALFLIRKARALAQGGDGAALALIKQARSLYDDGVDDGDPAWAWWIDERELSWHEAMCREGLGDLHGARDRFERSVEATPGDATRSQYLHRGYLLHAQVGSRSWSAAAATMQELVPLSVQVASNRTMRLILDALDGVDRAGTAPPGVKDAGRQLRSLLAGSAP
jgi:hypothetical protein